MYGNMYSVLPYPFRNYYEQDDIPFVMKILRVSAEVGSNYQKFGQVDRFALVSYATLVKLIASGLSPQVSDDTLIQITNTPVEWCTKMVYFNM